MKQSNYLYLLIFSVFVFTSVYGQDSSIRIRVYGNCEMCKERIEEAAKGKGVKMAEWSIESGYLILKVDPLFKGIDKVHQRIADAGHDTELKKAKDIVYADLPQCCKYRDGSMNELLGKKDAKNLDNKAWVKGVVLEQTNKGSFKPLVGATVTWLNSLNSTLTDSAGVFSIKLSSENDRLIVSYTGYTSDTMIVAGIKDLMIVMATDKQLSEVKIFARQRSTHVATLNPIRTQIMSERELFKAACCNLSESFETNPSVDVSYNDAVTGSKQIQLLGLSGNYTQLTVENLPGPRGIATPIGLNFIAGPWVESIQLNKGVGSVVNGFESIAGQINIELKKPEKAERLYANGYINNMGKSDLNLILTQAIGKKWSTALLLHDNFLTNKNIDFNNDGFRDLPTGNQFSAVNRWKFEDGKGFLTQFGFKILKDNRTGGERNYNPGIDKFTTNKYGLGINTKRYEAFAKAGYVFPEKKYKSIGLQLSLFSHQQNSYFGLTAYDAKQNNLYANLIYQSIIGNTNHKFRTGLSFSADKYDEEFKSMNYQRTENVPGGFFEYTFTPVEKFNIVAGLRADYNSLFGWFATPRLHLRYEPVKGTTIRLSAGRGQRTANIFAENMSVFVSARQVNIISSAGSKAYGFDPEVAWNKGISLDQKLKFFKRDALISLDYFRNDFTSQVVVDLEDTRQIMFYTLDGKSFSNSFQAELNMEPARKFEVRLAYRFFDVKTTYGNLLLQKPLTARHRAFVNLAYEVSGWKIDYTLNYNGGKRIPSTSSNPLQYQRSVVSPDYLYLNAQVSKTLGKKHPFDLYMGGENLGNFFQRDVIIASDMPFSNYFDAALVWGPVSGRLVYAGFRYKIK